MKTSASSLLFGSILLLSSLSDSADMTPLCNSAPCIGNYICSTTETGSSDCYQLAANSASAPQAGIINSTTSLQDSYTLAQSGDTIKLLAGNLAGDFTANLGIDVSISGGYSPDFSSTISTTIIQGKVQIQQGLVHMEGVSIGPSPPAPPIQLFVFGSNGGGNGQFRYPRGIVLDADNNIYVADSGNHRIQKFTSSGSYVSQWGSYGSSAGQFMQPSGLALNNSKTQLNVVDSQNHRIQVFDLQGNFVRQFGSNGSGQGQLNSPRGIALDSSDFVYVTDSGNNRIQKFDSNGDFVMTWGTLGTGEGQFNQPYGIATDKDNNIYVMEIVGNRGQKFASTGAFTMMLGTSGKGDGQLQGPDGIAVNGEGIIFVCDEGSNRLEKFSPDGSYISQIGGWGFFYAPHNLTLDANSNAYVTDELNDRVKVVPAGYNGF